MRSESAHRWHKKPAMRDVGVYRCQKLSEMRRVSVYRCPNLSVLRDGSVYRRQKKEECEAKDERNLEPEILHESMEC